MPSHPVGHRQKAVPVAAVQPVDMPECVFLVLATALHLEGGDAAGLNVHGRTSDYTRSGRYGMVRVPTIAIPLLRALP